MHVLVRSQVLGSEIRAGSTLVNRKITPVLIETLKTYNDEDLPCLIHVQLLRLDSYELDDSISICNLGHQN
jgi:hypothetical protein